MKKICSESLTTFLTKLVYLVRKFWHMSQVQTLKPKKFEIVKSGVIFECLGKNLPFRISMEIVALYGRR